MLKEAGLHPKLSDIVKPSIEVAGDKHELKRLFDEGELPVMKAVGFARIKDSSAGWVSYTITIQGNEVLSIEVDEPNVRSIAEDNAKIGFVTNLIDKEF